MLNLEIFCEELEEEILTFFLACNQIRDIVSNSLPYFNIQGRIYIYFFLKRKKEDGIDENE